MKSLAFIGANSLSMWPIHVHLGCSDTARKGENSPGAIFLLGNPGVANMCPSIRCGPSSLSFVLTVVRFFLAKAILSLLPHSLPLTHSGLAPRSVGSLRRLLEADLVEFV